MNAITITVNNVKRIKFVIIAEYLYFIIRKNLLEY